MTWLVAGQYLSLETLRARLSEVQTYAAEKPLLAGLAFAGVYAALTAASVPAGTALTMLGGAIFGTWIATGIVSVAATVGATGAMLLSRFLLRDWVTAKFGDRMEPVQQRIEREGRFYLFALRLTPVVPFFVINLAVGPTRMGVWPFAWVSWVGMLPGIWLYANAGSALGTIESPTDLLSPFILISLTLLGVAPLLFKKALEIPRKTLLRGVGIAALVLILILIVRGWFRYRTADAMSLTVKEYSNAEYPEDPNRRSVHHGKYSARELKLNKRDETHFDFVLESKQPHVARIVFKNVDAGLMTPSLPEWTKGKKGIQRVALNERQWNRQQVSFGGVGSPHLEVTGGDGFEARRLHSAELVKNGLNAGLWEVMLYTQEGGEKALYYQGWFSLPLGHYWSLFEKESGLSYWRHFYYLEHRCEPDGVAIKLEDLRTVLREVTVPCGYSPDEAAFAAGEQSRRRRTLMADNVRMWKDFFDGRSIRFAAFVAPGRYTFQTTHGNQYLRMNQFDRALVRDIRSPADNEGRSEIELQFSSTHAPGKCRFLVSGFRWDRLPRLGIEDYPKGLYYPMGIGVPPYNQNYDDLLAAPPQRSPYFSLMLDEAGEWINHHKLGIDGPILHRDAQNPNRVHLYLVSYERHTLLGHWTIDRM